MDEPDEFWSVLWQECAMVGERGDDVVVFGSEFAAARFFPEARLSVVEKVSRRARRRSRASNLALDETGRRARSSGGVARGGRRVGRTSFAGRHGRRSIVGLPNGIEAISSARRRLR